MLPMIGAVVRSVCCRYFKSSSCFSLFHGGLIIYANRHFGYALIFQFYFSSCCRDSTIVDEIRRVSWKLTLNICADIIYSQMNAAAMSVGVKEEVKEKKFSVHSDPDISSQRRRQFVYFRNSFEIEFKALFGREFLCLHREFFIQRYGKSEVKKCRKIQFWNRFLDRYSFENVKVNSYFFVFAADYHRIFFYLHCSPKKQTSNKLSQVECHWAMQATRSGREIMRKKLYGKYVFLSP